MAAKMAKRGYGGCPIGNLGAELSDQSKLSPTSCGGVCQLTSRRNLHS
jgi:hypothetical protein